MPRARDRGAARRRRAAHLAAAFALALVLSGCGRKALVTAPQPDVVPASDSAPSWSPDGARIVYAHTAGTVESADRAGIYVVDAAGGEPVQVVSGAYGYPDWSPDGMRLAITGWRGRQTGGVFTVTAEGGDLEALSNDLGYAVKWSPDGRTLAYETYDASQVYRLWLMNSDGSNARCLNPWGDESWFEPNWSPDSQHLTHVRLGYGVSQPEIFVMDATGWSPRRMTDDGFEARYPAWSPDGRWIAWGSWHGQRAELWLVQADGAGAHKVADGYWPEWAPDSRRIVYTSPDPASGAYRVFTIDIETGAIRQITH